MARVLRCDAERPVHALRRRHLQLQPVQHHVRQVRFFGSFGFFGLVLWVLLGLTVALFFGRVRVEVRVRVRVEVRVREDANQMPQDLPPRASAHNTCATAQYDRTT
jgi:hypothetical protein